MILPKVEGGEHCQSSRILYHFQISIHLCEVYMLSELDVVHFHLNFSLLCRNVMVVSNSTALMRLTSQQDFHQFIYPKLS